MGLARDELMLWGGVAVVGLLVLWKVGSTAKGIVTNDNALTRSATDANGDPVTAYKESPIPLVGTLGAAANAASGGWLASAGQWLGDTVFNATHDNGYNATAPGAPPPATSTGEALTDSNAALIEAGYNYTPGLL